MNNFSSSQEFILSQNGIHILPLGVGKKAYTHPDIVAIPLKDNVTVSYNFIVNHMLFSSEFAFVLRHTIKLKSILCSEIVLVSICFFFAQGEYLDTNA